MKPPLIGITLDYENDQKYSAFPYYALRENYITSTQRNGGTPILLPFELDAVDHYADLIDGLIITGGNFDISPNLYGDAEMHGETKLKENRTKFEWQICQKIIDQKKPLLGVCGGMQLLNVILGGDLIQHIPDEIENALEHETKPYDQPGHTINIKENSLLFKLSDNKKVVGVNSSHHQAAGKAGNDLIVSGTSSDGVVEAIEHKSYPFMLGVQWHPEYQISDLDKNIFREFIRAASETK